MEKALLTRAGLRQVDEFVAMGDTPPEAMHEVLERSRGLCLNAVRQATAGGVPERER